MSSTLEEEEQSGRTRVRPKEHPQGVRVPLPPSQKTKQDQMCRPCRNNHHDLCHNPKKMNEPLSSGSHLEETRYVVTCCCNGEPSELMRRTSTVGAFPFKLSKQLDSAVERWQASEAALKRLKQQEEFEADRLARRTGIEDSEATRRWAKERGGGDSDGK